MIIFDPYVPGTWLADGLSVHIPTQKTVKRRVEKTGSAWKAVLNASLVSVGMALVSVPFLTGDMRAGGIVFAAPGKSESVRISEEPEVRPGHWLKLVTLLRASPSLPDESTANDPAPLV